MVLAGILNFLNENIRVENYFYERFDLFANALGLSQIADLSAFI